MRTPQVRQRQSSHRRAGGHALARRCAAALLLAALGSSFPAIALAGYYQVTTTADGAYPGTLRHALSQASEAEDTVIEVMVGGTIFLSGDPLPAVVKPTNAYAFSLTGNNVVVDGTGVDNLLPSAFGIVVNRVSSVALRDFTIQNFTGSGVVISGQAGSGSIENVDAVGNKRGGFEISGVGVTNLIFDGIVASDSGTGHGVSFLTSTSGHVVRNCTIENNFTNGIIFGDLASSIAVENCFVTQNFQNGVHIVSGANNITIGPDNSLSANNPSGVQIVGPGSNTIWITDNTEIDGNIGYGVNVQNAATGIWIVGNSSIDDNNGPGIGVEGNATQVRIIDNASISSNGGPAGILLSGVSDIDIHGNGIANNFQGIQANGPASSIGIGRAGQGNTISGHNSSAIVFNNVDDSVIQANQIFNNVLYGLELNFGSSDNVVGAAAARNFFDGNQRGIVVDGASDSVIRYNDVYNSDSDGILLTSSSAGTIVGPGNDIINNGNLGFGAGVVVSTTANDTVDIVGNLIQGDPANQGTGIVIRTAEPTVMIDGNVIEGHTARGAYSAGVSVEAAAAVAIVNDNTIGANHFGVYAAEAGAQLTVADNTDGACVTVGILDNLSDGVRGEGGIWSIDNTCFAGNGGYGVFVTLKENDGNMTPVPGTDELAHVTLTGNQFASNLAGGAVVLESYVDNVAAIRNGTDGNDFGGQPGLQFAQRWYGAVELRNGDGDPFSGVAQCYIDQGEASVPPLPSDDFCPTSADIGNYKTWKVIDQLRIDAGAGVRDLAPHAISATSKGAVSVGQFAWDGCETAADANAAAGYNIAIGAGAPCAGNRSRFQVATLTVYPLPEVRFATASYEDDADTLLLTVPTGQTPKAYIEVSSQDFDDPVTVTIRNLTNGDVESGFELTPVDDTDFARSVPPLEVRNNNAAVANDGILDCENFDELEVRYWNVLDPSTPVTWDTILCQEETPSNLFFCGGPNTRTRRRNQIIGSTLHVCLDDLDENESPTALDTIAASQMTLRVQQVLGGVVTIRETETTSVTEIAVNAGQFYRGVTQFVSAADQPYASGDGVVSCAPGDQLFVQYVDPDNAASGQDDTDFDTGICVLTPTASQLRLKAHNYFAPSIKTIKPTQDNALDAAAVNLIELDSLVRDQWFYLEVVDPNRNYSSLPNGVDKIPAGDSENAASELDAILRSWVTVESFSAGGQRIDWIKVDLAERGAASSTFRGVVRTSSHFGANDDFANPNDILLVEPGGSIRAAYVDSDHPALESPDFPGQLGLLEPCPAGFSIYDCRSITIPVIEANSPNAVTFSDQHGNPSNQFYLPDAPDVDAPYGVIVDAAAYNRLPTTAETFPFGLISVEDAIRFDGYLPQSGLEDGLDSGVFLVPVAARFEPGGSAAIINTNRNIESAHGNVLYTRVVEPAHRLEPSRWIHDTAVLCFNSPSYLSVTDGTSGARADVDRIRLDDKLMVTVFDQDQNVDGKQVEVVTVSLTSQVLQDSETLALIETGPNTGKFSRSVDFPGKGDAVPGDSTLRITDKDTITIRYVDNATRFETSPYCESADQATKIFRGDSRDRITQFMFVDAKGRQIEDLPVGEPIRLRAVDIKGNANVNARDTVTAEIFLDPERRGRAAGRHLVESVGLTETGNRTGVFEGAAKKGPVALAAAPSLADLGPLIGSWYSAVYYDTPDDKFDDIVISAPIMAMPLKVTVTTRPEFGSVGDAVMVEVQIWNPNQLATLPAELLFYDFRGLPSTRGSLRLNGKPVELPEGQPWRMPIGQVQPLGQVRLVWTAAVSPIAEGTLRAWGEVWAQDVLISERGSAEFKVVEEPLFTKSTVFLNVFHDANGNGLQEFTERPIADARIVSGDGFSVRTDKRGQAHFANLTAGPNAFRLDIRSLPAGWAVVGRESEFVELFPGMLHSVSFGVRSATETVVLEAKAVPWKEVRIDTVAASIPLSGSLDEKQLFVANKAYPMVEARVSVQSPVPNAIYASKVQVDGYLQVNTQLLGAGDVEDWALIVYEQGRPEAVKRFAAPGAPPPELALKAGTALGLLKPGRDYDIVLQARLTSGFAESARLPVHVYLEPPKEDVGVAAKFETGQATLDPYTILALREAAYLLQNYPGSTVLVEGFTDNSGTDALNRALSQRRADMAKDYLVIVEGVEPDRITPVGRGATSFVASNDTEAGKAQNRRVEISVFGLPQQQARVFKPSVRAADGTQVAVTQNNRFATQGQVDGDRLNVTVQFPSGATYAATISVPETRVTWRQGAVVVPPDFEFPLTLTAPVGTTVEIADRVIRMDVPTKEVVLPLAGRAAVRAQFYPPDGPSMSWVGLVKLLPTDKAPPGLAAIRPKRFVVIDLPRADVDVRSGSWTVTGQTAPGTVVRINGDRTTADANGNFSLPVDVKDRERFNLDVSATHPAGVEANLNRSWQVEDRHVLAVGVAQLSSQYNRRADYGSGERTDGWEHKGYGRFYVEGELRGDVLLKARLHTEDRPLETFLPDLLDYSGPAEDLIDPRRNYLVYGDDSTSVDEAPGEGPIVLLLAWRGQLLEIGTVQLDERASSIDSRTEISYGGHVRLSTATAPTETSGATTLDAYGTRPNSARAQDRFAATGGLVYYLRHTDIQEGSERIWVEDEDQISGIRRQVRALRYGEDYTVDYLSGRIWLVNPVALAGPPSTVVRDSALGSAHRWIVASYRYTPNTLVDAAGHGEMLRQDFGRWGEAGIFYREEEADTQLQRRGRGWVEITPVDGTQLEFEAGRRWGAIEEYAVSLDGGLTYDVTRETHADPANAFAGSARTEIGDVEVSAYGRHLDENYGGLRYSSADTIDAGGLAVAWNVRPDVQVGWRGDINRTGETVDAQDRVHASHPIGPVEMTYELRHESYQPEVGEHNRVDGGVRAVYPIPPHWSVYGEHQQEIFQHGLLAADSLERRSTVGAGYQFSTTWNTFLEVTEGNRERGGRVGGGYGNEKQRLTLSYGLMQNVVSDSLFGVVGAGAQQQVGPRAVMTGAQEFRHGDRERGLATIMGSQVVPVHGLTLGFEGERGRFVYGEQDQEIVRSALRGRVLARLGEHRLEARGGWSLQERPEQDIMSYSSDDSWRTRFLTSGESMFRFRFAKDVTRPTKDTLAEFYEWAVGAAYRPIQHNRLQLLSVLSWARERLTPTQDPSHALMVAAIGSLDGTVRIAKPLEVGWKLAGKRSGVEFEGFKSEPVHTLLNAWRLAWIFFEPFDLLGEYRLWKQWETTQLLHGPLVELGVRPHQYVRFGMGYNFTTFRDELRPHDRFDAEGFRLRLIGVF